MLAYFIRSTPERILLIYYFQVLITLVFKVIGEVEGGGISSFSIVNTVDGIKNTSVKKEMAIESLVFSANLRSKPLMDKT